VTVTANGDTVHVPGLLSALAFDTVDTPIAYSYGSLSYFRDARANRSRGDSVFGDWFAVDSVQLVGMDALNITASRWRALATCGDTTHSLTRTHTAEPVTDQFLLLRQNKLDTAFPGLFTRDLPFSVQTSTVSDRSLSLQLETELETALVVELLVEHVG